MFITDDWFTNIQTLQLNKNKNKLEIIYKSNQRPSEVSLGLDRQSVLIRKEVQVLLI